MLTLCPPSPRSTGHKLRSFFEPFAARFAGDDSVTCELLSVEDLSAGRVPQMRLDVLLHKVNTELWNATQTQDPDHRDVRLAQSLQVPLFDVVVLFFLFAASWLCRC